MRLSSIPPTPPPSHPHPSAPQHTHTFLPEIWKICIVFFLSDTAGICSIKQDCGAGEEARSKFQKAQVQIPKCQVIPAPGDPPSIVSLCFHSWAFPHMTGGPLLTAPTHQSLTPLFRNSLTLWPFPYGLSRCSNGIHSVVLWLYQTFLGRHMDALGTLGGRGHLGAPSSFGIRMNKIHLASSEM